jgi:frataxin-like iron-binding protein CyaY
MKCPNCQTINEENAKWCGNCGHVLSEDITTTNDKTSTSNSSYDKPIDPIKNQNTNGSFKKPNKVLISLVSVVVLIVLLIGTSLGFNWPVNFSKNVAKGGSNSSGSKPGSIQNSQPYSHGTWSSGKRIDTNLNNFLRSVSCPTTNFCVAVDESGYEFTYTNGTWSSGQQIDTYPFYSVSCPTANFCVAVDGNGYEFTYTNGTWSSGQQLNTGTSVSCPTTNFCVAVDNGGYEYTYSSS